MLDVLDERLRDVLRRERIDPMRDASAVRVQAEAVVQRHTDLSLTGAVAPLADSDAVVEGLVARVSGFGPLQALLDDPDVEEIWVNQPDSVWVARNGRHERASIHLTRAEVAELVERMLAHAGRHLDRSAPFADAMLPDGSRLHVVLDGIARGFTAVNVRKHAVRVARLDGLVRLGSLTPAAARFLDAAVLAGLNVLVAGGTQTGKTTMVNALAGSISEGDRVISAEEVFELGFEHADWVPLQTRQAGLEGTGEVRLRDLVREALRMRPSRIVVGEVRGAEAFDLLIAMNSGLPAMSTIHANSAREALTKLGVLALLAGENVPSSFVAPTVAASVDVVVHLRLGVDGVRTVSEIVAVSGRVEGNVIESALLFERRGDTLVRAGGGVTAPRQVEAFRRIGVDPADLLRSGS